MNSEVPFLTPPQENPFGDILNQNAFRPLKFTLPTKPSRSGARRWCSRPLCPLASPPRGPRAVCCAVNWQFLCKLAPPPVGLCVASREFAHEL